MNFGDALALMRSGQKVRRPHWDERELVYNSFGILIKVNVFPIPNSVESVAFKHFWAPEPGGEDLLANDWEIARAAKEG